MLPELVWLSLLFLHHFGGSQIVEQPNSCCTHLKTKGLHHAQREECIAKVAAEAFPAPGGVNTTSSSSAEQVPPLGQEGGPCFRGAPCGLLARGQVLFAWTSSAIFHGVF